MPREQREEYAKIASSIFVNQIGMMATGLLAQPAISFCLKMSLEKGVGNGSYEQTLRLIRALEMPQIREALRIGYHRRVVSAIPPVAIMSSIPQAKERSPIFQSMVSATLSTVLGRNLDPKESLAIVNSGKSEQEILARNLKAAANIRTSRFLLFLRNFVQANAIFSADSLAEEIIKEHGETISTVSGIDIQNLTRLLPEVVRFASCAATTPLQNLYARFASGAVDSFSREMLSTRNLANLFHGSPLRAIGIYVATKSLSLGKEISGSIEVEKSNKIRLISEVKRNIEEIITESGEELENYDCEQDVEDCYNLFVMMKMQDSQLQDYIPPIPSEMRNMEEGNILSSSSAERFDVSTRRFDEFKIPKPVISTNTNKLSDQSSRTNKSFNPPLHCVFESKVKKTDEEQNKKLQQQDKMIKRLLADLEETNHR